MENPGEIKAFLFEFKGEREQMQDYHLLYENFEQVIWPDSKNVNVKLYAIFDGHNGKLAAKYARENLPILLALKFNKLSIDEINNNMKKNLIDIFKTIDENFLIEAAKNKPTLNDGSTATVILIINSIIYIANIGDSMAVLCRQSSDRLKAIVLTENHSPSVYEERVRIQKCGGKVIEGRLNGILELSRSFGDGKFKSFGLTSLPCVKRCKMQPENDSFILLACDGVWKAFSPEDAIKCVNEMIVILIYFYLKCLRKKLRKMKVIFMRPINAREKESPKNLPNYYAEIILP